MRKEAEDLIPGGRVRLAIERPIERRLTEWGLSVLERVDLRVEGQENFTPVRKHLENGSVIAAINHASSADPPILLRTLEKNLGGDYAELAFFASRKHLVALRYLLDRWIILGAREKKGFTVIPVVQHNDEGYFRRYGVLAAARINKEALNIAEKILSSKGSLLAVAPEGTRSEDGTLDQAQRGIELLLKRAESSLVLPIGIIGSRRLMGKRGFFPDLDLKAKVTVKIGEPVSAAEILAEATKELPARDVLMLRLANLLPEEMWGVYADQARANLQPR